MIFTRTFKGYEDRTAELDNTVNEWVATNKVDVVDIKTVLSHEPNSRANSGDLVYTVVYRANQPLT